ncbi:MAG: hypothetical protein ABSG44_09280 [Thermodesulfobacteriota bacterium]|jgi:hypothetical protein
MSWLETSGLGGAVGGTEAGMAEVPEGMYGATSVSPDVAQGAGKSISDYATDYLKARAKQPPQRRSAPNVPPLPAVTPAPRIAAPNPENYPSVSDILKARQARQQPRQPIQPDPMIERMKKTPFPLTEE